MTTMNEVLDSMLSEKENSADGMAAQITTVGLSIPGAVRQSKKFPGVYEVLVAQQNGTHVLFYVKGEAITSVGIPAAANFSQLDLFQ